jgi:hypothetical protein
MRTLAVLAAVAGVVACTTSQTPTVNPPTSSTGTSTLRDASADAMTTSDASIVAGVHVESRFPGDVQIVNDTNATVRINWNLPIEREEAGVWTVGHTMTMMQTCFAPPPPDVCVAIAPHSSYAPLPWTGWFGCTQCGVCRANAPARAGRYRVVAVECDAVNMRREGPVMTLVDDGRFAKTPHVYAPADDPAAIVVDNEADEPASFRVAVDVARLDAARGAYETVEHAGMLLSPDCLPDAGANACVTVPAHGTLRSMGFRPGCPRCAKCEAKSVRSGTYLFTTQLCEGSKPFYNDVYGYTFRPPSFVVDAAGHTRPER